MRILLPKYISIYKEFPRPVRLVFIFLVVVILLLLALSVYQIIQLNFGGKTNQNLSSSILKNRQGPLYGIGGEVSSIDGSRLVIKADIGKEYYATVNDKTAIASVSRKLTKSEVKTTYEEKSIKDIKVGDRIYLQAKKDLLKENNLSPDDIKSIEIYVE